MERWTPRNELLSELYTLRNLVMGQLAEIEMAIMRENNAHDAKIARTVTQQTKELLNRAQQPRPLWATRKYQEQAMEQSDVEDTPPYENLIQ